MVRKKEPVNWTIDSDIIEKIKIESKNNYFPGETVEFKITLYNDNNEKISGNLNFIPKSFLYPTMTILLLS